MNKLSPKTKLEREVAKWLNSYGDGYEDKWQGAAKDLLYGGCQSGIVGSLVYYTDTVKFYKKHKTDINKMLRDILDDSGMSSPAELFGDKWEKEDIFAEDDLNQNLLAWFGFEEAARRMCYDAGYEV